MKNLFKIPKLYLMALALIACACGNEEEPPPIVPDPWLILLLK